MDRFRSTDYELVSIIIPTRNEEKYIGQLLDSLVKQNYPKNKIEVLIFDGMSNDKTTEIVRKYKRKLNIKIFKNKKIKQVFAFNEGIKKAKAKYFFIIGAHSKLDKNFIRESYETFKTIKKKEPKLAGVGGFIENIYENFISRLVALLWSSPFAGGSSFRYSLKPGFKKTVVFALYDKEIVKKIGGFDEDFITGQDFELNLRLNKRGYKLYYNPRIISYYYTRNSLGKFIEQNFNYGAVKGMCIRTGYKKIIWWFPLIFLIYEALLVMSLKTRFFSIMLIPLIIYLTLDIISSLFVLMRRKDPTALLLIIMHPVLHNIVAFGFIKGLIFNKKTFKRLK